MELMQPFIIEAIAVILTGVIAWLSKRVKDLLGLEVEKRHREALHQAVMTGVRVALGDDPVNKAVSIDYIKRHVREHVFDSVPDAVAALVPGDTVLDDLAERYVHELLDRFK